MAEFALAIPGLFLNCVDIFELVELGRDFDQDFGSWHLQLQSNELRFKRWGEAAGITDEESETFVKQLQKNNSPQEIKLAYKACYTIKKQLERANEDSKEMASFSDDAAELVITEEFKQLEISTPDVKHADGALKKLKNKYQRSVRQVVVRSKWALYKRTQLKDLLEVIAEHVTVLEQLFPQQAQVLVAEEAKQLDPEAIKALKDVVSENDPFLRDALHAEAVSQGFLWEGIEVSDYNTARLGKDYRKLPPSGGSGTWTKLKSSGNSVIHAGHTYGYEKPPAGSSWHRITATRHAALQSGNNYWQMPEHQGQSSWANVETGGMSAVHAGNNIGYEASSQMQSAWDRVPGAMDDDGESLYLQYGSDQLSVRQGNQAMAAKPTLIQALPYETQHEVKQGTESTLRQFEPSKSLKDRLDVYDDGRRSIQDLIITPEMSSADSKSNQGNTGLPSIGNAPTRALSSTTGSKTHGIPSPGSGSDEHGSDATRIHTDERERSLDTDIEITLAKALTDHIVRNVDSKHLKILFDRQDALASITELIEDFSALLGVGIAEDDARSASVVFIKHNWELIANELASAAKAWRPSSEDQVSTEEKLKILHFGDTEPTQCDDPGLEPNPTAPDEEKDRLENLYTGGANPELHNIVLGRNFVLKSEELAWMIGRIRMYESLSHTGNVFSSVRSSIARTIASHSGNLKFSLDWDILTTLNEQYDAESCSPIRLSDMIVYNGTPSICYASTTAEYVKQIWPALGTAVVECFDRALVSADGTSTLELQDSRLRVELDGATTKVSLDATTEKSTSRSRIQMLEAAEVCVWLAVACNANTHEELIALNFPQLANLTGQPTSTEFSGSVINDPSMDGQCWFDMVNNPVIASGYPIPKREDPSRQQGLEVSLGLMAALSHADWVTNFGSKLLLKGSISALVPITEVGMSIVWHFLINANQESMSYHQACAAAIDTPHLTSSDLECRRHFVGIWAQSAHILAGSDDDTMYDLHPSRSKAVSHSTISLSGLSINGGKFLTVGTTFNIGKKDLAPALKTSEPHIYENHISNSSNMTVLFYSSRDRRGWLLDGASALVHLARAWLKSRATKHGTIRAIEQLSDTEDNGERLSAMEVLRKNQGVKIYEDTKEEDVDETSISVESMSEHGNPSTDSGYISPLGSVSPESKRSTKRTTSQWTYKALIIDLCHNLEAMKAKLVQLKRHGPEVSVRLPSTSPILTGWDVTDFLAGQNPLEPRFVRLKSEGKHWNKLRKEIFSVPLMAESFHELILPADPDSQVCQSASTLPAKRDLLAVPLSVLLLTANRFLRWQENLAHEYARVTDHTFLVTAKRPKAHCRCFQDANCEAISGLTKKAIKGTRTGPSIFERCPEAVVIIGMPDTRRIWEYKTQDRESSKQAVLPVSDRHATSSSSSVGNMTSDAQSASQDSQANLNESGSDSHHAASTSSSVANITSDARLVSQDSQMDLSEWESDSPSDGSFYESYENL